MVKYVIGAVESHGCEKDRFYRLLDQYPSVIEELSNRKGAKEGQQTLEQLDRWRYGEAIKTFSGDKPERQMELEDVKKLVEWKLRHGKFRPSLMNLVSSNPPALVKETIKSALAAYRPTSNAQAALTILTKLKGIGPATASLLLSVHDPDKVIFFSDEAYWWVCCGIRTPSLKYTMKEYQELQAGADGFCARVGCTATQLEKVSYVMKGPREYVWNDFRAAQDEMSGGNAGVALPRKPKPAAFASAQKSRGAASPSAQEPKPAASSKKRKSDAKADTTEDSTLQDPPLRRSKRNRAKA